MSSPIFCYSCCYICLQSFLHHLLFELWWLRTKLAVTEWEVLDQLNPILIFWLLVKMKQLCIIQYSSGNLLLPIILDIWFNWSVDWWLWNWASRLSLSHRFIDLSWFFFKILLNTNWKEWSLKRMSNGCAQKQEWGGTHLTQQVDRLFTLLLSTWLIDDRILISVSKLCINFVILQAVLNKYLIDLRSFVPDLHSSPPHSASGASHCSWQDN